MIWKAYAGRCIYHDSSHDIHLQVHQNMLYRWLTLGSDAIQTLINRRIKQRLFCKFGLTSSSVG